MIPLVAVEEAVSRYPSAPTERIAAVSLALATNMSPLALKDVASNADPKAVAELAAEAAEVAALDAEVAADDADVAADDAEVEAEEALVAADVADVAALAADVDALAAIVAMLI